MFSSGIVKNAQYRLASQIGKYNIITHELNNQLVQLQNERKRLSVEINKSWEVINAIRHMPEEYHVKMEKIKLGIKNYEELLKIAENMSANSEEVKGAAAGVATGGAIAVLGGPALTSVVMSLGAASTGTSIAALSGAAASNATLALIGGGTLAEGGLGIAGGEAVLAGFGPLGVLVGGLVAAGTGIHVSKKRKESASKLNKQAEGVAAQIRISQGIIAECEEKEKITYTANSDLNLRIFLAMQQWPIDFIDFNDEQIYAAGSVVNNTLSAEKILNSKIEKISELTVEGDK